MRKKPVFAPNMSRRQSRCSGFRIRDIRIVANVRAEDLYELAGLEFADIQNKYIDDLGMRIGRPISTFLPTLSVWFSLLPVYQKWR